MGVNGLLPRLAPACHDVDLTRLLRDGVPASCPAPPSTATATARPSNKRRRTCSPPEGAEAAAPPPAGSTRTSTATTTAAPRNRRRARRRRRVRVAVDASGWIARACHGQGAALLDGRHLTNYGRAELAELVAAEAAAAEEEEEEERAGGGDDDTRNAVDSSDDDASNGRASPGGGDAAAAAAAAAATAGKGKAARRQREASQRRAEERSYRAALRDEFVSRCVASVTRRVLSLRDACLADVLVVLDGASPPVKAGTCRERRGRRERAAAVRDGVAGRRGSGSGSEALAPAPAPPEALVLPVSISANGSLGMHLRRLDAGEEIGFGAACDGAFGGRGAIIERVGPGSHADRAGLRPGDVIARPGSGGAVPIPYDTFLNACRGGTRPVVFEALRRAPAPAPAPDGSSAAADDRIRAARRAGAATSEVQALVRKAVLASLRSERVPFLVAPYEADGQLAYLSRTGLVDLVVTDDSDLVGLGARNVLYKLGDDRSGTGQLGGRLLRRSDLGSVPPPLGLMDFTDVMLAVTFVAAGCDYCPSLRGIGIVTARNVVKAAFHGGGAAGGAAHCEPDSDDPRRHRRDGGRGGAAAGAGENGKERVPILRRVFRQLYAQSYGAKLSDQVKTEYEANFLRALLIYRHPVVFDPLVGRCVFANGGPSAVRPDPELAEYGPYRDLVADLSTLEGVVGRLYDPTLAVQVAEGWVDPRTGRLYDEGSTPGVVVEAFRAAAAARGARDEDDDNRAGTDDDGESDIPQTQDDGPVPSGSASLGRQAGSCQPTPTRPSQSGSSSQGTTLTSSVSKPSTQGSSQPSHASNLSADVLSPNLLPSPLPPSPAVLTSGDGGGMMGVLERLTGR